MSNLFRFKQFDVDQSNCAMKVNTDGAILGALAFADQPKTILDIGTGTGVIALMLAQRFPAANIDAVEIDQAAAQTAESNFTNSTFKERLRLYASSFGEFLIRILKRATISSFLILRSTSIPWHRREQRKSWPNMRMPDFLKI